jgi:excisionase family DNA binding protein
MAQRELSLLTTGQAAKLCDVTPDTILKWIRKGHLRGARTAGGHYRISLQDLEPHIPPGRLESLGSETPICRPEKLRCWEYLSDNGVIREECKKCVTYRVGADQCFQMADLGNAVGHARRFCRDSCEECEYYRRVQGLPTNVLVITSDAALLDRLSTEENRAITLRFAKNAYEASAIIQTFFPAFIVVDQDLLLGDDGLLDYLANDPRLPGAKIILGVQHGTSGKEDVQSEVVFSVIEKPFGSRRIATVVNSFPIDRLPSDGSVRV